MDLCTLSIVAWLASFMSVQTAVSILVVSYLSLPTIVAHIAADTGPPIDCPRLIPRGRSIPLVRSAVWISGNVTPSSFRVRSQIAIVFATLIGNQFTALAGSTPHLIDGVIAL